MVKKTTVYDESSIQVLEYPENIQRRPGMYVGGKGESALHHLAIEVIDNAVDEALAGACTLIDVTLHTNGSITVVDNGRGFPVGLHPEKQKSTLEIAFTELHSGGKFEEGSYSTSGGLHGVGIKATNALSTWLEVEVKRDGVLYFQRHERGLPVTAVQMLDPVSRQIISEVGQRGEKLAIKEHGDRKIGTGSRIVFLPNPEFLDVIQFDFNTLARRLQTVAFLVPGLQVHIRDEREPDLERSYQYKGGIAEYVAYLNQDRSGLHEPIEIAGKTEDETRVEIVFQYHDDEDEEIISFVNTIPTPDGGKHVAGFRSGLTKAINVFAAEKKLLKNGDEITGRDTIAGLTGVISISMRDPQFTSQTKTQLGSDQVQGQVNSIVYEELLDKFRKKIPLGKAIVARCLAASHARHAAAKARELVMRRSVLEVDELPGKLADVAKGSPVEQTSLFIVEGDSAGGSCKQARNRNYHAILPLRGKILNTQRIRLGTALANAEVKSIIAAIGAGVGSDFDTEKMRYGRVAILVDADVDGEHIKTLLYTLFWRLMRAMVEAGRLYVARAPLYLLRNGKESVYAFTDGERDRILSQWGQSARVTIQRYKGLGEMNPEQLRETIFKAGEEDPALNEHMLRVTANDIHAANTAISLWMGGSPEQRRDRLMTYWDGQVLDDNGTKARATSSPQDDLAIDVDDEEEVPSVQDEDDEDTTAKPARVTRAATAKRKSTPTAAQAGQAASARAKKTPAGAAGEADSAAKPAPSRGKKPSAPAVVAPRSTAATATGPATKSAPSRSKKASAAAASAAAPAVAAVGAATKPTGSRSKKTAAVPQVQEAAQPKPASPRSRKGNAAATPAAIPAPKPPSARGIRAGNDPAKTLPADPAAPKSRGASKPQTEVATTVGKAGQADAGPTSSTTRRRKTEPLPEEPTPTRPAAARKGRASSGSAAQQPTLLEELAALDLQIAKRSKSKGRTP